MQKVQTAWILLLITGLTACAASGTPFTAAALRDDRALVYIYRSKTLMGSAVTYDVRVGNTEIVTVKPGGYYPYFAAPGETEFWARTETRAAATENLRAGQTYYLKAGLGIGLFVGHPKLQFVPEGVGQQEIWRCKLLPGKMPQP